MKVAKTEQSWLSTVTRENFKGINAAKKLLCMFFFMLNFAYADDTTSAIKIRLKVDLPELKVDQVNKTPVAGVYEVVSGRRVFYVDSTGQYAFLGNLVDLDSKQSLTEKTVKAVTVVNWNQLPIKLALRQTIGAGNRRIAIFTDPDCPFCKRLEQEVTPKLKDVVIYYFLFPLKIHEDAVSDSKKILCAQNPESTFAAWMALGKKLPTLMTCRNALKLPKMQAVGNNIVGVDATPTIVLPNGQIVSGLLPADYLNKLITDTSGMAPQAEESKAIMESTAK